MRLPIIVSAILPLIIVPETSGWADVVVGVASWLVFLVDYVVHSVISSTTGALDSAALTCSW